MIQEFMATLVKDMDSLQDSVAMNNGKSDKLLPKFDPDKCESQEDHVNNFFLDIHLLNVQHKDVVCRLFPYTFLGISSTWYFILPPRSITSWDDFERVFIKKFRERKTTASMHKELGAIMMEKKRR
jgi:hypothetical protein